MVELFFDLVCGLLELLFSLFDGDRGAGKRAASAASRRERERRRGVAITFEKRRIVDIAFRSGPAEGKRASALSDMELKRLAHAMPHRVARFAIRRYLRHRKAGRVAAPDAVVR